MNVLVTGANGYLGQGIVKQLLDDGVIVTAVDFSTEFVDDRATKIDCNAFDVDNPYEYFGSPDVLLHLAWRNGFVHNDKSHVEDLPKHYEFIKSFIESGIKRVCVMGTMHEIGFYEGCIDENTPTNPINPYGIAKNALRNLVKITAEQRGCVFQWLRGYYIVGNATRGNSIFSKITEAASLGKKEFPFTTGKCQYDFIDYDQFCLQVAAAAEQEEVAGIINICSGEPEKLADRVERFIFENGFDVKLQYGKFPERKYDSKAVWGNDNKIRLILENRKGKN